MAKENLAQLSSLLRDVWNGGVESLSWLVWNQDYKVALADGMAILKP